MKKIRIWQQGRDRRGKKEGDSRGLSKEKGDERRVAELKCTRQPNREGKSDVCEKEGLKRYRDGKNKKRGRKGGREREGGREKGGREGEGREGGRGT